QKSPQRRKTRPQSRNRSETYTKFGQRTDESCRRLQHPQSVAFLFYDVARTCLGFALHHGKQYRSSLRIAQLPESLGGTKDDLGNLIFQRTLEQRNRALVSPGGESFACSEAHLCIRVAQRISEQSIDPLSGCSQAGSFNHFLPLVRI